MLAELLCPKCVPEPTSWAAVCRTKSSALARHASCFSPQLSPTLCADNVHTGGCCTRGAATQRLGRRSPDGCSRRVVVSVERHKRVAPCSGTHRRGVLPSIRRPQLLLQRRRRAHGPSTSSCRWPRTLCSRHLARCAPTMNCLPVASCMRVMTPECSMQPR